MPAGFSPGVTTEGPYDPSGIIVVGSNKPYRVEVVTILSGQNLPAGRLIGKITTGGKFKSSLSASADGSQLYEKTAVLLEACDASGGDKQARALITGEANLSKVSFDTGQSYANGKIDMEKAGLFFADDRVVAS